MIFSQDKQHEERRLTKGKGKGETPYFSHFITSPLTWEGAISPSSVGFVLWFTLPISKSWHQLSHSSQPRQYLLGLADDMKKTRAIKPHLWLHQPPVLINGTDHKLSYQLRLSLTLIKSLLFQVSGTAPELILPKTERYLKWLAVITEPKRQRLL